MRLGEAISVREATRADRNAMLDLWVEAWTAAWAGINFAARREWLDGHLDQLISSGVRILVATQGSDRLAGFVTVDPVSGELDQLVTAVSSRRQGVGERLLRQVKHLSPRGMSLSVNQGNAAAIRLYEREGFRTVGAGVGAQSGLPLWHMRWPGDAATEPGL